MMQNKINTIDLKLFPLSAVISFSFISVLTEVSHREDSYYGFICYECYLKCQ